MRETTLSRRRMLIFGGLSMAGTVLAACAGAATPTVAPTKPAAEPTKPAAAAASPTAAAAATKPAEPTKPAAGTTPAAATTPATAATPTTAAAATKPAVAGSPTAAAKPAAGSDIRIAGPFEGEAKALTGAGATFPAVLYTKWFNEYEKLTQVKVNYQAIGSGGGIKNLQDQTVDFGGTDAPMTDQQITEAKGGNVFHIPTALGAVVATYNIAETQGKAPLKFTGDTLAGIYLGEIKTWNDPKLTADNPDLASINKPIIVVRRSDSSGTTFTFTDYLTTVNTAWKDKVGKGTSVNWPVGIGGKGNDGVAGEVKQNPYSIGYVELIYALQQKLGVAQIKNKAGNFVDPKLGGVSEAAAGVAGTIAPDLRASIVNAEGAQAYPISTFTWIMAYEKMTDKAKATSLTRLLWWATTDAQKFNEELGFAAVPPAIVTKGQDLIRKITVNNEPAFPGR
jgi:phosphate transport system substrate-binding protein